MIADQTSVRFNLRPDSVKFCFWRPSHRDILSTGIMRADYELHKLRGTSGKIQHGEKEIVQALGAIQPILKLLKQRGDHLKRLNVDAILPQFGRFCGLACTAHHKLNQTTTQKGCAEEDVGCMPSRIESIITTNVKDVMNDPKGF
jgi:hypothetical protein